MKGLLFNSESGVDLYYTSFCEPRAARGPVGLSGIWLTYEIAYTAVSFACCFFSSAKARLYCYTYFAFVKSRPRPKDIFGLPALSLDGCGSGVELTSPSFKDGIFLIGCIEGGVLSAFESLSLSSLFYIAFKFRPNPRLGWAAGFCIPPRLSFIPCGYFVSS